MAWLFVVCVATLFIVESGSSPACEIPAGHTDGEHVSGPREPKGGHICQRRVAVEIVTRQCETRYCCGSECTCLDDVYENSTACIGEFTELSCFVEHKETRGYENVCCGGYEENDGICEDIDECETEQNTCDVGCHNTNGGFQCYCLNGYQLAADGHTCNADQTCNNRCDHQCALVRGTYRCTCRSHYVLGEDETTCYPMTTCSVWNDCEQVCNDTEKGFECSCHIGYRLNLNGYTCNDINECHENERVCDHECVNTNGSFRCYCDFGFLLNATDGRSCIVVSPSNSSLELITITSNSSLELTTMTSNSSVELTTVVTSMAPMTNVTPRPARFTTASKSQAEACDSLAGCITAIVVASLATNALRAFKNTLLTNFLKRSVEGSVNSCTSQPFVHVTDVSVFRLRRSYTLTPFVDVTDVSETRSSRHFAKIIIVVRGQKTTDHSKHDERCSHL
ncbi:hypothetical protein LSAT2_020792 [Lamellibrachia satsuma]|nr:hypothetical protein LSAT2_020792 [Lamellibrachia satsuma]